MKARLILACVEMTQRSRPEPQRRFSVRARRSGRTVQFLFSTKGAAQRCVFALERSGYYS